MNNISKLQCKNALIDRLISEAIELYEHPNFNDEISNRLSEYIEILEPCISKMAVKTFKMRMEHYAIDKFYSSEEYKKNPNSIWRIGF